MFRQVACVLAATAALGAAALVPTAASAHPIGGFHGPVGGHFGPHFGPHYYGGARYVGHRGPWGIGIAAGVVGGAIAADACYRLYDTPYGPRWVNICY
jgi:hypothetical protein